MNNALIFIPDISGFTNFVNATPVEHSRHVIGELLEIILKANTLGMVPAEVEGDAVLFYKEGPAPTFEEILAQAKKMYVDVHTHLKRYESLRICNCDACSTASGLGIKFFVHYGEVGFIEVLGKAKPHGKSLILIHRVMKNSVPEREYLLLTKDYCDAAPDGINPPESLAKPVLGTDDFDLGEVRYEYIPLAPFLSEVPPAPLPLLPERSSNPVVVERYVPAQLDDVFDFMIDLDKRALWNPDLKMVDYDPEHINRSGMTHRCLVGNQEFIVETTKIDVSKLEPDYEPAMIRTFGERAVDVPVFGTYSVYYILKQDVKRTSIRIELHLPKVSFFKRLLLPVVRRRIGKNLGESLNRLEAVIAQ